jgi:hypothetical protein
MSKFEYILGWIAVAGSIGALIGAVIAVAALDESAVLLLRVIWMPFTLAWGVRKVREYSYLRHQQGGSR